MSADSDSATATPPKGGISSAIEAAKQRLSGGVSKSQEAPAEPVAVPREAPGVPTLSSTHEGVPEAVEELRQAIREAQQAETKAGSSAALRAEIAGLEGSAITATSEAEALKLSQTISQKRSELSVLELRQPAADAATAAAWSKAREIAIRAARLLAARNEELELPVRASCFRIFDALVHPGVHAWEADSRSLTRDNTKGYFCMWARVSFDITTKFHEDYATAKLAAETLLAEMEKSLSEIPAHLAAIEKYNKAAAAIEAIFPA